MTGEQRTTEVTPCAGTTPEVKPAGNQGRFTPPPGAVVLSASQVSDYRRCSRLWAWRNVAGVKLPQHPGAALGTEVDDEQLQPYLREGRPFDFAKRKSAEIAESMRPHLPRPRTVETQKQFVLPSPVVGSDVFYLGYMDMYADDAAAWPGVDGGLPAVGDSKTTKNLRYAKTEAELRKDPQAVLYATDVMFETGHRAVWLEWLYGKTEGANAAKRVHLRVEAPEVVAEFLKIDADGQRMAEIKRAAPARAAEPTQEMADYVRSLPMGAYTTDDWGDKPPCLAYGPRNPCGHMARCSLSPAEMSDALASMPMHQNKPKEGSAMAEGTMSAIEKLKAKKAAAQQAGAPAAPAAAPLAPTPAAAQSAAEVAPAPPAALPAWATADVDPLKAKVEAIRTGAAGGVTQPPPAWAADPKGLPGSYEEALAAGQVVGINPPESALPPPAPPAPPAPPVGVAAPVAAPTEPAKATRGRKVKQTEDVDAPIPYALTGETVRVVWGAEKFSPIQYNNFDVGPFEATTTVQPGETIAQASARAYAELEQFAEAIRVRKVEGAVACLAGLK